MTPQKSQPEIDFTRVMPRNYKSQWRFIIDCPANITNKAHYYRHYMQRWSVFISQIMRNRLTKTQVKDYLPQIRDELPIRTSLADIFPLLSSVDRNLSRLLLDCSAVFDAAPHELRSHIVCSFGITPDMLRSY